MTIGRDLEEADVGYLRTQIGVFRKTIRTQTDPATLVDGSK
jgi:hypothetical protein